MGGAFSVPLRPVCVWVAATGAPPSLSGFKFALLPVGALGGGGTRVP